MRFDPGVLWLTIQFDNIFNRPSADDEFERMTNPLYSLLIDDAPPKRERPQLRLVKKDESWP